LIKYVKKKVIKIKKKNRIKLIKLNFITFLEKTFFLVIFIYLFFLFLEKMKMKTLNLKESKKLFIRLLIRFLKKLILMLNKFMKMKIIELIV
jgi:hypothetical protein